MELAELENMMKAYDRKLSENVRLVREVAKNLLANKSEKRLNKEKIRALYNMSGPLIFFLIIKFFDFKFYFTTNFYIGLGIFVLIYSFWYILSVKHYILLRKIDFTEPVLSIKKKITELEKFRLKMNRIRNIFTPVIIVASSLMFIPMTTLFSTNFLMPMILMVAVFVGSIYYTQFTTRERYKALNKGIEELESLEK